MIFGACVGILFLTAIALQRLTPSPLSLADTIDLDFDGFGAQARRLGRIAPARGLVAAALMTLATTATFILVPPPARVEVVRDSFTLFPREIGAWTGTTQELDAATAAVLGASDYVNTTYSSPDEATYVNFFSAWYVKQTEGAGIHSPKVCLPVGGWEVFSIDPTQVSMPGTVYGDFMVNRAVIQKGLSRQLVYYWFEQRGRRMTNDFAAKITVIYDSLTIGRTDGAMVRFVTPIDGDTPEAEAAADARMQRLMAELLPGLPRFIPE